MKRQMSRSERILKKIRVNRKSQTIVSLENKSPANVQNHLSNRDIAFAITSLFVSAAKQ